MTSRPTSHITVSYWTGFAKITHIYAASETTLREAAYLTGEALEVWLRKKGCKLDCADGPAKVVRFWDGMRVEFYYRDGVARTKNDYYFDAQHPLYVGTGLTLTKYKPGDMEALLREATQEQSAPSRPDGREYVPLPLTAMPKPL